MGPHYAERGHYLRQPMQVSVCSLEYIYLYIIYIHNVYLYLPESEEEKFEYPTQTYQRSSYLHRKKCPPMLPRSPEQLHWCCHPQICSVEQRIISNKDMQTPPLPKSYFHFWSKMDKKASYSGSCIPAYLIIREYTDMINKYIHKNSLLLKQFEKQANLSSNLHFQDKSLCIINFLCIYQV